MASCLEIKSSFTRTATIDLVFVLKEMGCVVSFLNCSKTFCLSYESGHLKKSFKEGMRKHMKVLGLYCSWEYRGVQNPYKTPPTD